MKKKKVAVRTIVGFGKISIGPVTVSVGRRSGGRDRFLVKVSVDQGRCGAVPMNDPIGDADLVDGMPQRSPYGNSPK